MNPNLRSVGRLAFAYFVICGFVLTSCSSMTTTSPAQGNTTQLEGELSALKTQLQAMESTMESLQTALQNSQQQLNATRQRLEEIEKRQKNATLECACGGKCCQIPRILKRVRHLQQTTDGLQSWVDVQKNKVSVEDIVQTQDALNQSITAVSARLEEYIKSAAASALGKPNNCRRIQPWIKGTREIWVNNVAKNVTCDGEWTVIQKRWNGEVDFYRGWNDYVNGFGDATTEYWLGLEALYKLTDKGRWELRVELEAWDNSTAHALYKGFKVLSSDKYYALQLGQFASGNAGDSLKAIHGGMKFTTKDSDNDKWKSDNCAVKNKGGWWYNACLISNLNGKYYNTSKADNDGLIWKKWKGFNYSLKTVFIKIRPV